MSSGPLTVSAFIQNVSHMYCGQKLSERIYWTGVYDRRKHLFENMWPLPEGVSYNSYLIKDEKCALMDTVESGSDRSYGWPIRSRDARSTIWSFITWSSTIRARSRT